MLVPRLMRRAIRLLMAVLFFSLPLGPVWASPVHGFVVDALTGEPVAGATVRLASTLEETFSDQAGGYAIQASDGVLHVLEVEADGYHRATLSRQDGARAGQVNLLPLAISSLDLPAQSDHPVFGVPWNRLEAAAIPGREIRLPFVSGPGLVTVPAKMPETIRVGRRFASSCSGNPVQRIDEMPFEDYVCGVLPPEIGVFKSVPGGPESSRAVFEAFAVLARSYALWYSLYRGADADWHIDDTACEQRYEDNRDPWITAVVLSTVGQVLVKASDPGIIDKYEYAASCGRNGSRPAYQTEIVPDDTPLGCTTGGWCGHDNCAAHEANPNVSPPENRCLVRGVCQWGSLERSLAGQPKDGILGHYQRNLVLIDLAGEPVGNLVGLVKAGDLETGDAIEGAEVRLDSGEAAVTTAAGLYRFDSLPHGNYAITVEAPGFQPATREKEIDGPGDHWASIALNAVPDDEDPDDPTPPDDDPGAEDPDGGGAGLPRPTIVSGGCACSFAGGGEAAALPLSLLLGLSAAALCRRRRTVA